MVTLVVNGLILLIGLSFFKKIFIIGVSKLTSNCYVHVLCEYICRSQIITRVYAITTTKGISRNKPDHYILSYHHIMSFVMSSHHTQPILAP